MKAGDSFPPVVLFDDGNALWLADGFYRVAACRISEAAHVSALVYEGGRREALLFAAQCNETHGQRRGEQDRRKAVMTLLADPEWAAWGDGEIAKVCGVSRVTVLRYRSELGASCSCEQDAPVAPVTDLFAALPDDAIAAECNGRPAAGGSHGLRR